MKRLLLVCLLVLGITINLTGCASGGGNPAPTPTPTDPAKPQVSKVVIELGRAAARIGLSAALRKRGVSEENIATIMAKLKAIVDATLAGQNVREILADQVGWEALRSKLVSDLANILTEVANVNGVQLIDQASAEALIGSLLDAFAAAVRGR